MLNKSIPFAAINKYLGDNKIKGNTAENVFGVPTKVQIDASPTNFIMHSKNSINSQDQKKIGLKDVLRSKKTFYADLVKYQNSSQSDLD